MKLLYALAFVLSSLAAATAQTQDASMNLDDSFGEIAEHNTTSAQIAATEPTIELGEADSVAITSATEAEHGLIGAIQPSDEAQPAVEYSTGGDDKSGVAETVEQSPMPSQIAPTKPTAEKLDEADGVAITATNDVEDGPVGAIQPTDEAQTAEHSTRGDDNLTDDLALILIDRQLGLPNE